MDGAYEDTNVDGKFRWKLWGEKTVKNELFEENSKFQEKNEEIVDGNKNDLPAIVFLFYASLLMYQ